MNTVKVPRWHHWFRSLRDRRGAVSIIAAAALPVLGGMGALGIEYNHAHYERLLLEQTVESAALAGANVLATYYTAGTSATIVSKAQTIAVANMPIATFGTVVPSANVLLGTWNTTTSTFTSGGTTPNAVQVTGLETKANSNPIKLFFGAMIGYSTYDITATAVASYGTGQTFNTIIINDMSQSFLSELSSQQSADTAILNCIASASGSASAVGLTTINGHSWTYVPLTIASTGQSTIQSKINALSSCITPYCSTGSNVASGIYSAIQQYSGSAYSNSKNNIIIITDGVPNVNSSQSYKTIDGIGPTMVPLTSLVCSLLTCTDANLLTMAQNQAAAARAAGISISTIYYSGDTTASSSACTEMGLPSSCSTTQLQTAYANALATLTGGTGISLVAPSAATISSTYAAFCSTMASSIKKTS